MNKEKFIKSTIILIVGGFIIKVLGMIIRILTTRVVGIDGIGLYMLILPTFSLFITITQLGFPVAISKIVAENKKSNRKLMFSIMPIVIVLNIILMVICFLIAPILSNYLLQDDRTLYPIMSIALVLPFISISCIVRAYFFGKEMMMPHIISHIVEQIVRLVAILLLVPYLLPKGLEFAVCGIVLVNIASELISIIILGGYLPKNFKLKRSDIVPDIDDIKEVLSICLPTTGSKIISSLGYFLEPIILTFGLVAVGYSNGYIVREYGILTGYTFPILMLPSFFSAAIASALIPVASRNYANNNYIYVKRKLKQAINISLIIGILCTSLMMIKPELFLNFIYNTNEGVNYLRLLAPVFLLFYIQIPLSSTLQAIGKAKETMYDSLIGIILKTIILFLCSYLKIGMYALVIAISANAIVVTYLNYRNVKKALL
jgi:stage V sporulation protein B